MEHPVELQCCGCYRYFPGKSLTYHGPRWGLLCDSCLGNLYETYGKTCPDCGRKTLRLYTPRLSARNAGRVCRKCAERKDRKEATLVAKTVRDLLKDR